MEKDIEDDDPWYWCTRCGSARIVACDLPGIQEYCDVCGCTEIKQGTIEEWKEEFKDKKL
jgi:hypothetical protein